MDVLVRKYGGSSLEAASDVMRIAESAALARRLGHRLVVVVSARGNTTDDLLDQAGQFGSLRPSRETDQLLSTGEIASAALLSIALQRLGVPAVSLSGAQAGIRATGRHGAGVICEIDPQPILRHLEDGQVVVVAGFQAVTPDADVLTLGRGGSDTTAVALTGQLGGRCCEIYTDVAGVYTADPRAVPDARVLPTLQCTVMAELAFAGAKVLHARAVELAALLAVPISVRSSFLDAPGTDISAEEAGQMLETRSAVIAVAHDLNVARILIQCDAGRRDLAVDVLQTLADYSVPADLVARSGPQEEEFRMGFTIRRSDLDIVSAPLRRTAQGFQGLVRVDEQVAKVSLIGVGLLSRPEYTAQMLGALRDAGIDTSWITTSQLRASAIVALDRALEAVQVLHDTFDLAQPARPREELWTR